MARVTVDFSETTVFVAGGTSGINFGIAEAFATAGARVAVMSRSKEKVDAAVARLQALGAPAIGGAADVRDRAQRRGPADEVGEQRAFWLGLPARGARAPGEPGGVTLMHPHVGPGLPGGGRDPGVVGVRVGQQDGADVAE